jgi:hypothetical protein
MLSNPGTALAASGPVWRAGILIFRQELAKNARSQLRLKAIHDGTVKIKIGCWVLSLKFVEENQLDFYP